MIRLDYNRNGSWSLLGHTEDSNQHQAQGLLQGLVNITGDKARISRERANNTPEVLGYCEPEKEAIT